MQWLGMQSIMQESRCGMGMAWWANPSRAIWVQTFKQMKEESGKQAQLNAQMAKLLRKRDKEFAHQQEELAGAQAKAVQLAVENQKLKEQVCLF